MDRVDSMKNSNTSDIDFHSLNQALEQMIVLLGQVAHRVTYHRGNNILRVLLKDSGRLVT